MKRGNRILVSVIENRAKDPSSQPWASVPVDEHDLSQGFKDISFWQLNNYANHAVKWLSDNLPPTNQPFECFAYAGSKDLRYAILAVAAAKMQKVLVLPSPMITPEAQLHILNGKDCTVYLRPDTMAESIGAILKDSPHIEQKDIPSVDYFMQDLEAEPVTYAKSWEEGKDDPWLVFHTSSTTGTPKIVTHTHRMLAWMDYASTEAETEPLIYRDFAFNRAYTPLPSLHSVGMFMSLSVTTFLHATLVIGPPVPPTAEIAANVLHHGKVDGVLLPPALIEELLILPAGLEALRSLKFIHYVGSPLSAKAANQLLPYVKVVPNIGSSETNAYPIVKHNADAWDYVKFQEGSGAIMEHRFDELHELIFVRQPGSFEQQVFQVYPDRDRHETSDLWKEHPEHKGLWKIIGRSDDAVSLSHGDVIYAADLESIFQGHPDVKTALIGGTGYPRPMLLVELFPNVKLNDDTTKIIDSLRPYVDRVNSRCSEFVKLSPDRILLTSQEKPVIRTAKGSVARLPTMQMYTEEIASLYT